LAAERALIEQRITDLLTGTFGSKGYEPCADAAV